MPDTLAGAAANFAAVGATLTSAGWLTATHRAIGAAGKRTAVARGGTMHRWNKRAGTRRPVKLTAGYEADTIRAAIRPRPAGFWAIRESGATGHTIGAAGPNTVNGALTPRRGRRTKAVSIGPGRIYARVEHPGAPGQKRWTEVRAAVNAEAPRIVHAQVTRALAGEFGR